MALYQFILFEEIFTSLVTRKETRTRCITEFVLFCHFVTNWEIFYTGDQHIWVVAINLKKKKKQKKHTEDLKGKKYPAL